MNHKIHIHYLEVVTDNVEQVCANYSGALGITFGDVVAELGNARTADLDGGGLLGVREPMHEAEEHTTRPYYLVTDIVRAAEEAKNNGAEVVVPPMDIPGHGKCAIVNLGAIQSGLWQL